MMAVKDIHDGDEDARMSLIAGAEFMALHGQGTGHCTTHTHLVEQEAKTQTDDLVENPEFLNSGMLVGEDPTLITCSRTPPPIGTNREVSTPTSIPEFWISGMQGTCCSLVQYNQVTCMLRGRTNHDTSSVYKISCNMCEKHFFEGSKGQEAQRHVE